MLTAESLFPAGASSLLSQAKRPRPRPRARYKQHRHRSTLLGRSPVSRRSSGGGGEKAANWWPAVRRHPAAGRHASGPADGSSSMSSAAPLLGGEAGGGEPAPRNTPSPSSWVGRVVDAAEARAQLGFAVPMVLTSMAYYGIPLVSVMFSGQLGDVHLAGATLGNSWATVTGYAFVVRILRPRARPSRSSPPLSCHACIDRRVTPKTEPPTRSILDLTCGS
jgi:multidrug resistance protein, MATE family